MTPATASGDQKIQVAVTVKNTGDRAGKEVVQLYLNEQAASITPPLKRLKRFAKIQLQPGESRRYTFELPKKICFSSTPKTNPLSNLASSTYKSAA